MDKPDGRAYIVCKPFYSLSLVFCFACKSCPVPLSLASLLCKLLTENSLLAAAGVKGLETEIHFSKKKKNQVLSDWAQVSVEKHNMPSVKFLAIRALNHFPSVLPSLFPLIFLNNQLAVCEVDSKERLITEGIRTTQESLRKKL